MNIPGRHPRSPIWLSPLELDEDYKALHFGNDISAFLLLSGWKSPGSLAGALSAPSPVKDLHIVSAILLASAAASPHWQAKFRGVAPGQFGGRYIVELAYYSTRGWPGVLKVGLAEQLPGKFRYLNQAPSTVICKFCCK